MVIPYKINGTAFEIIAKANGLEERKPGIFRNPKGVYYHVTPFGFYPLVQHNYYLENKVILNDLKETRDALRTIDKIITSSDSDKLERIKEVLNTYKKVIDVSKKNP